MRLIAPLAVAVACLALAGLALTRRNARTTMQNQPAEDNAAKVKAIYARAKSRIAELKRRRRETAENFARAADRARMDSLRKDLD
jgi:hypothetical protein